ncbi:hypothetical protein Thiosp_03300 [Thiorhodovibrio litoralis]|nr:hypothetical protein Thiosp_03300 [Thiorhodovibrio litoralis]
MAAQMTVFGLMLAKWESVRLIAVRWMLSGLLAPGLMLI